MTTKVAVKNLLIDERSPVKGVLVEANNKLYSCALNQTDIKSNKNKFYIMQLIKSGSSYTLLIIYGRTGESGKVTTKALSTEDAGIRAFETQFKTKTGNAWRSTDAFVKKDGKYFMSEVSYDDEIKDLKDIEVKTPPSKLDKKVQELITMLSDTNMMNDALVSLDIDTKKMPLGKLKESQLKKAEKILDDITKILEDKKVKIDPDLLTQLSSEYYTFLPISCGRKKPPVIDSSELIDKYKQVIDELRNMVVAVQIKNNVKSGDNPLDSMYADIKTEIKPLDKGSKMYEEILKYVANTQGSTHGVKLEVLDIFEIEQEGKKKAYEDYSKGLDNKMLLYHGSAMSNWLSIMKHGLLINPNAVKPGVFISGAMFSAGLYFANCVSKSWNYCRTDATKGIGCLALAEVSLGNVSKRINADYHITKESLKKTGHDSVQGQGQTAPKSNTVIDNLIIPNGPLAKTNVGAQLLYDEFIIYEGNRHLIKYLVIIKNNKH
ncbi:MAG: polyADP-ribose polymerase [Barrevirus sp.]|uniref:PolyADP-ribose polymerase n=1 Tax=Barrevirus sp. TaxID=2487763 RepID=A0A3G4ZQL2_9VIRU|nr:MAG: polyADP-ribose polymerase [Barrevirus sp.]